MRFRLRKLNTAGVAHHLLIAVVAVSVVAGFGAYKVFFSKAATGNDRGAIAYASTPEGCWLAGRTYDSTSSDPRCTGTCRDKSTTYVAAKDGRLGYCTLAVAIDVTDKDCGMLGRRYVNNIGCSRKIAQVNDPGATQCRFANNIYIADAKVRDYCALKCPDGFHKAVGVCPPVATTGSNNVVSNDQAACTAAHRVWDANTKTCKATCVTGYVLSGTTCVTPAVKAEAEAKAACTAAHKVWDTAGKKCGTTCMQGYTLSGAICTVSKPTKSCAIGVVYDSVTDTCADGKPPVLTCVAPAKLSGTQCVVTGTSSNPTNNDEQNNSNQPAPCTDGSQPGADGKCATDPTTAPTPETNIVEVDTTINDKDCLLLGREWIPKATSVGQKKGCSMESCNKKADVLKPNNGKPFCESTKFKSNFALRLSKAKCDELHRQWIQQVDLCANFPNQERKNKEVVNAPQCVGKFSTYYIRPGTNDECFTPKFFNRAQAVAKKVGAPLGAVVKVGPAAFCNAKKNYTWDKKAGQCKKDRVVVPQLGEDEPEGGNNAPNGQTWSAFCQSLGRTASGNGCSEKCIREADQFYRDGTTASAHYGYDKCRDYSADQLNVAAMTCNKTPGWHWNGRKCVANTAPQGSTPPKDVSCYEYNQKGGEILYCELLTAKHVYPFCQDSRMHTVTRTKTVNGKSYKARLCTW